MGFRWSVYLGIIHLVSVADHQLIQSSWILGVNEGNEPSGDEDDTCRNDSVDIDGYNNCVIVTFKLMDSKHFKR